MRVVPLSFAWSGATSQCTWRDATLAHQDHTTRLPDVKTDLPVGEIRDRLREANRRGRLPEVHWESDSTFRIALASRPAVTDLIGRIIEGDAGRATRLTFDMEVHCRFIRWMVAANLACAVIGPWSTELFIEIYSWWWQPPLCVLTAAWVAWKWPSQSLADAEKPAAATIREIESRLAREGVSTAAAT